MHTSKRYMNLVSKKFPYFKTLELTTGSCLVCQEIWFRYLFISSSITKVGHLFVNQVSAVALP